MLVPFQQRFSANLYQHILAARLFQTLAVLAVLLLTALPASSQDDSFLLREDDRIRGDQQAPVTLLEYSDFTCGFCE